jgi:CDP-diacylglycerol--glycerol-3-phosphate 3-phosphatidyltransferase
MGAAPAWMVAVIIGREFAVTGLRSIAYSRGTVIASSPMGKAKMTSQVVAILLLILGHEGYRPFYLLGQAALWVVVILSVVSAVDYYRKYARATALL